MEPGLAGLLVKVSIIWFYSFHDVAALICSKFGLVFLESRRRSREGNKRVLLG